MSVHRVLLERTTPGRRLLICFNARCLQNHRPHILDLRAGHGPFGAVVQGVMDAVNSASSVITLVDLSFKLIGCIYLYAQGIKNAKNDKARLLEEATRLHFTLQNVKDLMAKPQNSRLREHKPLKMALYESEMQLHQLAQLLPVSNAAIGMSTHLQNLKWPFQSKDADKIIHNLGRISHSISLAIQIDQTTTLGEMDLKLVLYKLPIALGASFDSHAEEHNSVCLPNTRVDVLERITKWLDDPNSEAMFWLNGMAGTGKSTISRTLAHRFSERHCLAASFFFKRGEADRGNVSKLIPTLASHLMVKHPAVGPYLKVALEADPALFGKTIREQFEKLILKPLSEVDKATWKVKTFAVILDALDECDREEDMKLIIQLFSQTRKLKSTQLKIFITSRPELPIRIGFVSTHSIYRDLVLHDVDRDVVGKDLRILFEHNFGIIKLEYNCSVSQRRKIPLDWPIESDLQSLVDMAIPFFLFAATVCRFIADRRTGSPQKRLRIVLDYSKGREGPTMEMLYLPILDQQLVGLSARETANVVSQFRYIVGTLVILASPLAIPTLAELIDVDEEDIEIRLDFLHSVLSVPTTDTAPVRLLHISFRDFLLDPQREGSQFWVEEKEVHRNLALNCIRIMTRDLHQDICNLEDPDVERSSINPATIDAFLSPTTQYACLHWVYHLKQGEVGLKDNDEVFGFLTHYFLYWIESLSLLGKMGSGVGFMETLQTLQQSSQSSAMGAFLQDAIRFLLANITAIDANPLQLYSSALIFAPRKSIIRQLFHDRIPQWVSLAPDPGEQWDRRRQTLECQRNLFMRAMAFSPDSKNIVAISDHLDVDIWQADSGDHVHTMKGPTIGNAYSALSPDTRLAASGSRNGELKIWETMTGKIKKEFKGHSYGPVTAVKFSRDSLLVAFVSERETIHLWEAETGTFVDKFKSQDGSQIKSIEFSPNSNLLGLVCSDTTPRIWKIKEGKTLYELHGHHDEEIMSIAFSPDNKLIASASEDTTIQLWQVDQWEHAIELSGHMAEVIAVAFSPSSSELLASSSTDCTIRIWKTESGECVQILRLHDEIVPFVVFSGNSATLASGSEKGTIDVWELDNIFESSDDTAHGDRVTSVQFSPDMSLLASSSDDFTIRLWRTETGECIKQLLGHDGPVTSIAFSPDSKTVVSGSDDELVRTWSISNGECIGLFEGHENTVNAVAFSPDSRLVTSGSSDETIRLWHNGGAEKAQVFRGHDNPVVAVAFSPDSSLLASASQNRDSKQSTETLRLWEVATNQCVRLFDTKSWMVSVAFLSNPLRLVSCSKMDRVQTWDVDSVACKHTMRIGMDTQLLQQVSDTSTVTTEFGALDLSTPLPGNANGSGQGRVSVAYSSPDYGISEDGSWITWRRTNLLWIPPSFRRSSSVVSGPHIAMGSNTGRVSIMRLAAEDILD